MIRPLFYAHLVVGRCSLSLELGAPSISDMLEYAQGCGIGGGQRNPNMKLSEVSSLKLVRTHALAGFKQHKNPAVVSCHLPLDLSPCLIFRHIIIDHCLPWSNSHLQTTAGLESQPREARRKHNGICDKLEPPERWLIRYTHRTNPTHTWHMYVYVCIYIYIVCVCARVFVYIYIREKKTIYI